MVRSSVRRLVAAAAALSLGLLAAGLAWDAARFGLSPDAAFARLEQDVRSRLTRQLRDTETLAERVAGTGPLIAEAGAHDDHLPALFTRLVAVSAEAVDRGYSATVWVPSGPGGEHRVLAWSAGPADAVPNERLAGTARHFIAPGTAGPRLVFARPIEHGGRRVGTAVAETVLAPASAVGAASYRIDSAYGPVTILPAYSGGASGEAGPGTFVIEARDGTALLEVRASETDLAAQRDMFRRRVFVAAATPVVLLLLLVTGPVLDGRRGAEDASRFVARSAAAALLVTAAALLALVLAGLVGAAEMAAPVVWSLVAVALATLFPVSWWWRPAGRRLPGVERARFVVEHLAAGLVTAAVLLGVSALAGARLAAAEADPLHSPLFPLDPSGLLELGSLLVMQVAAGWTVAALLASMAWRWRLTWRSLTWGPPAFALWIAPAFLALALPHPLQPLPAAGLAAGATAAAAFALVATAVRHRYRHTSQALRLVLLFGAVVAPPLVLSPVVAFHIDHRARTLIEQAYAPAVAGYPAELRAQLDAAQQDVDRIRGLADLVATADPGASVTSARAFLVWNQTTLSERRLSSEVELFGPDRALVSRFGLNVPEYQYAAGSRTWSGTSCAWVVFEELKRLGADDRRMLHAERALCDEAGQLQGAVVLHLLPDYRALPFVAAAETYHELLIAPDAFQRPGVRDLEVVVYGWGLSTLFTSGRTAWPVTDLFPRLFESRTPFWVTREAGDRRYDVFFRNDRAGIYALGVRQRTWFEHVSALAEHVTVLAGLFVLLLLGSVLYLPFARGQHPPLQRVLHEVRSSFYRKLFLFFVLAAVGPVLLLTLAFGAYMDTKLRSDVESESADLVTVARRVFEELAAAERHPDQEQMAPTDDVMVWIRQVVNQDVNLYQGPELVATSQRDLFDSGLLSTRTPAAAYRAIALDRLPAFVGEDRVGARRYLVAATPLPAHGRSFVLTVPLAPRQREIAEDLHALNRGVLVGAVVVILFAAGLGASVAGRIADPISRLTRATRLIAAGRFDVRIVADTADELRRLVDDFNSMTATLVSQRDELARTQQLRAWTEMARQVAHEIKNPLTPLQLAAEHLQRVHDDRGRPLGAVFDQCLTTIGRQVRLLRQIASEFANFAGSPTPRPAPAPLADLVAEVVGPYRLSDRVRIVTDLEPGLPPAFIDRTLLARALTNLVENAVQAMPEGGVLRLSARRTRRAIELTVTDSGVGMDQEAATRAFEPYYSTKTAGSGLGLANAKRNIELCGGTIALVSAPGAGTTVTITLPAVDSPGGTGAA